MELRAATAGDRERWDGYLAQHPLATPYHRFAWKEALEAAYGLRTAYRLAEIDGRVAGVAPAARVPHPLGRGVLCSLPYCDRGEPLADAPGLAEALVSGPAAQRGRSGARWQVRGTATADDRPAPGEPPPGRKVRMLLDLPASAEELFDGFKAKHRSQIRKAGKNGLAVSFGNDPARVAAFHAVYASNMRQLGSPPHTLRWFQAIATAFRTDCTVALVHHGDSVIGGGLVLRQGPLAAIPWASTLRAHNRLAPNMLLYGEILARCIEQGCARFDFGRSTVGEGTYRFKAQWGAQPVPLRWYTLPATPGRDEQAAGGPGRLRGVAEATWRRLPLPVTVALGGRLRKYISL
ncbi:MAG: GNAT family N-acetyltransferase [Pseudohaliea sp.]